ncbi:NAD(P)-dependent oxidoreductase [Glutamicibacter ectropisis]|uniref:NAD(P)-dependent oxidoreductase n=1 Tax=Glutamicibacter ectropisis TaxID=3046593 RepID=A0AAU6WG86_9MICC
MNSENQAQQSDQQSVVGVIGLGAIGRPMARLLATTHAGVKVTSSRAKDDVLADLSSGLSSETAANKIHWADNAAQLAKDCEDILLMLPDLPQISQCLEGPEGILAGLEQRDPAATPLLLLIGSTCSAPGVRALADDLAARYGERIAIVDAPVSGGEDGAIQGTLSIMLGGSEALCARATQVLAPCGTPVRLGELGAGQVAKACNQLVVSSTIFALGEASVLAERSGLDLAAMWDLLGHGYASSRLLDSRKDRLVSGDDSPSGAIKYMRKDLAGANEIAAATNTDPVLLPLLRQAIDEVIEAGLGDRDISVTKRFIAER